MKIKISKYSALIVSGVFNPLIIPTLGLLFIMSYIPGVEYFSYKLKLIILGVIFLSTCIIPLIFIILGNLHRGLNKESNKYSERVMPYLFALMSVFLGSQFMGKLPIPGIFRIFLLGICFTLIVSTLISLKWKFSDHTLALGGLCGTFLALNFKFGMNLLVMIVCLLLISGAVGSARIYLEKNLPHQIYVSYITGMICMFLIILFI